MEPINFCYWLQGSFEVNNNKTLNEHQTALIKAHLNMVFKHSIDPSMGDAAHQEELNKIHNPTFATNEAEAIALFGEKPSDKHEFNIHGWYDPAEGQPRC